MGKTYKIIVCGKKASGKTTLLEQLIYNNANSINSSPNRTISTSNSVTSNTGVVGGERYFSTIEDIYVACWEKDKGIKEKLRFYDTRGMENSNDIECINQMRHLFQMVDGAVLVFSSNDLDSIKCVEKLKIEIEKSKDKKEICHFILIDNQSMNLNESRDQSTTNSALVSSTFASNAAYTPVNAAIALPTTPNTVANQTPATVTTSPSSPPHSQQQQQQQQNPTSTTTPSSTNTQQTLSPSTSPHKEAIKLDLQTRLRVNVYEVNNIEKRELLCKPFIDLAMNMTQINTKGSMNLVIKKPKVFSSNK